MNKKRKAPGTSTGARIKTETAVDNNQVCEIECTTAAGKNQGAVEIILRTNQAVTEQSKLSSREILRALGMSDDRDGVRRLQKMIRDERTSCPIVSGGRGAGYWIVDPATPQGRADLSRCIQTYAKRGGNTFVTVSRLRRFFNPIPGQTEIGNEGEVAVFRGEALGFDKNG